MSSSFITVFLHLVISFSILSRPRSGIGPVVFVGWSNLIYSICGYIIFGRDENIAHPSQSWCCIKLGQHHKAHPFIHSVTNVNDIMKFTTKMTKLLHLSYARQLLKVKLNCHSGKSANMKRPETKLKIGYARSCFLDTKLRSTVCEFESQKL